MGHSAARRGYPCVEARRTAFPPGCRSARSSTGRTNSRPPSAVWTWRPSAAAGAQDGPDPPPPPLIARVIHAQRVIVSRLSHHARAVAVGLARRGPPPAGCRCAMTQRLRCSVDPPAHEPSAATPPAAEPLAQVLDASSFSRPRSHPFDDSVGCRGTGARPCPARTPRPHPVTRSAKPQRRIELAAPGPSFRISGSLPRQQQKRPRQGLCEWRIRAPVHRLLDSPFARRAPPRWPQSSSRPVRAPESPVIRSRRDRIRSTC